MDIHQILERASKLKIAVIGDAIEDVYVTGTVDRVSPEGPFIVLNKKNSWIGLGGAANVFQNLLNLGVDVRLYCNASHRFWPYEYIDRIFWNEFPHAVKTRFMSGNHHLLRVDKELDKDEILWHSIKNFSWWETLMNKFPEYDVVVMADYGKGVLSDSVINTVMEYKFISKDEGKDIPIIVDAKKDFYRYQRANILKCNKKEWESRPAGVTDQSPTDFELDWLVVTCGEAGISMYSGTDENYSEGVAGHPVNIVDPCGCGDTVTALLAIAAGIEASYESFTAFSNWVELANIAASEVCRHPGVFAIDKESLIKRFNEVK